MQKFKQLSLAQGYQIEILLQTGLTVGLQPKVNFWG